MPPVARDSGRTGGRSGEAPVVRRAVHVIFIKQRSGEALGCRGLPSQEDAQRVIVRRERCLRTYRPHAAF